MKKENKILVTGSKGFIGKHLMQALGDRAVAFDVAILGENILKPFQLEYYFTGYNITHVIHLAAISNIQDTAKNPQLALETNIIGTYNVLSLAKKYKAKTIVASSAAVEEPWHSVYGLSKKCMEQVTALFEDVIIARFYNVYGAGSKSVVNKFVKNIKNDLPIKLNGNTIRDYVEVNDVTQALIELLDEKFNGQIVSIGTKKGTTLRQLVKMIEKQLNTTAQVTEGPALDEIEISVLDYEGQTYGNTKLEEGIKKLI